ncbi:Hint domain-containing protein [Paracoccus sp. Z330]|uniref:Hint domain-containing protein n=1 Tax=Paracoccus onchidii TaxID=3017813 RepID=A0ABT4ZK72_9RHOB|nr:Hint domain-containing protein [Paracoccus onchidii]MDB6179599.1 Hint domain-containing protein [Paracoccus onchidii]
MTKIYMAYDDNSGSPLSAGGRTTTTLEFDNPGDVIDFSNGSPPGGVGTDNVSPRDYSNGITYNQDTGQWIAAAASDGIYVFNSFEEYSSNNAPAEKYDYRSSAVTFNNGFTYNSSDGFYYAASSNSAGVFKFASLDDMASVTSDEFLPYVTGGLNYSNGIEYNPSTNTWYAATDNGLNSKGALYEFSSLDDLLAGPSLALNTWQYDRNIVSYEAGIAALCFCKGTLIETINGDVAVEKLQPGDVVHTVSNGRSEIVWCGSSIFSKEAAEKNDLIPVRIPKGALGKDLPNQDLYVSPQHRILTASRIVERMFGVGEGLIAAKKLVGHNGINYNFNGNEFAEYYHIRLGRHDVLLANGCPTESLKIGNQTERSLSQESLYILKDSLKSAGLPYDVDEAPARFLIVGNKAKSLVDRHAKNGKYMLESGVVKTMI